jgi:hypothetical protein
VSILQLVTPSLVKPNPKTGTAPGKIRDHKARSSRRGRPPKNPEQRPADGTFQSDYERMRIAEIGARAQLFKLRIGKLSGELIDRKLLIIELTASFTAIREIILGSKLTQREKEALLRALAEIPIVLTPCVT